MMRSRFDEQLTQLNNSLIEMGALIEQAIAKAVKAFEEQDVESAQKIIESDDIINDKEKEIEGLCLKLLMNQQPVARDLRQVSTALNLNLLIPPRLPGISEPFPGIGMVRVNP
ncbi:hypothetical protein FACS189491_04660 [Spirochaetia bacterium]|nr:hypothetical protein FACS189491_04660 [Spirochaetia bacterium]